LEVIPIEEPKIYWESKDEKGKTWFKTSFQFPLDKVIVANKTEETLIKILQQAQLQNPNFLTKEQGFKITTNLGFPRNWGLGSSSTLLNNIAQWAAINPFELVQNTMGGSGYDVACARSDTPIHFQIEADKAKVTATSFNPKAYNDKLYFVHLNIKQDSQKEVRKFLDERNRFSREVAEISQITKLVEQASTIHEFAEYIKTHEEIIGSVLKRTPIQKVLFKDYFGQIKSLGAWGGDFILVTGNEDTPNYFKKKGYETVLLYDKMILKKEKI
jgi:mevalonate kinase